MRKVTASVLIVVMVAFSIIASARPAPDSGASGDKRRVLEAGLRMMLAVSIDTNHNGDYIGLYDVECTYAAYYPAFCEGSITPNGPPMRFSTDAGAVLVGIILKENIDGAMDARVIRAKRVRTNLVGDEAFIEGVTVD